MRKAGEAIWVRAAAGLTACAALYILRDYLLLRRLFYHDSLVLMTDFHLFFDSVFRGRLPLWTPYLNAGQRLWPQVETAPVFDPVAFLIWGAVFLRDGSSAAAFQWTCLAWLFLFAAGAALCARKVSRNAWGPLYVFVLLFGGPLAVAVPSQSQGFLAPFRYTPFVVLAYQWLAEDPTRLKAANLGAVLALSAGGYQTGYSFLFLAVFALAYRAAAGPRTGSAPQFLLFAGVSLAGLAAPLLAGREMLDMYPVARERYNFVAPPDMGRFLRSTIDLYIPGYGGSLYLGAVPLLVMLLAAWAGRRRALGAWEKAWLLSTEAMLMVWFGVGLVRSCWIPRFTFLGLRNWNFVLPLVLWGLGQAFSMSLDRIDVVLEKLRGIFPAGRRISWAGWALAAMPVAAVMLGRCMGLRYWISDQILVAAGVAGAAIAAGVTRRAGVGVLQAALVAASIAHILLFSAIQLDDGFLDPNNLLRNDAAIRARLPHFGRKDEPASQDRRWEFDVAGFVPYHYEGPSVWRRPSAFVEPNLFDRWPTRRWDYPVTPVTHQFRERRYEALLESPIAPSAKKAALMGDPQVSCTSRFVAVPGQKEALAAMQAASRRAPVVETPGPSGPSRGAGPAACTVRLVLSSDTRYVLEAETRERALLALRDGWARHWSAEVDGAAMPVLPVDVDGKGLLLDPGLHQISMTFRPVGYLTAFWLRAAVFAILLLGWAVYGASRLLALRLAGRSS